MVKPNFNTLDTHVRLNSWNLWHPNIAGWILPEKNLTIYTTQNLLKEKNPGLRKNCYIYYIDQWFSSLVHAATQLLPPSSNPFRKRPSRKTQLDPSAKTLLDKPSWMHSTGHSSPFCWTPLLNKKPNDQTLLDDLGGMTLIEFHCWINISVKNKTIGQKHFESKNNFIFCMWNCQLIKPFSRNNSSVTCNFFFHWIPKLSNFLGQNSW